MRKAVEIVFIILLLSFLGEAAVVWVVCWALKAIGITAIGSWTVAFSWPLVLVIWIISFALRSMFKSDKKR